MSTPVFVIWVFALACLVIEAVKTGSVGTAGVAGFALAWGLHAIVEAGEAVTWSL